MLFLGVVLGLILGLLAGGSLDNLIFIPVTTASKRLFNRDFLTMLIAQLKDPAQGQVTIDLIQTLLRGRHHIAQGALEDFNLTNPGAVMAQVGHRSAS